MVLCWEINIYKNTLLLQYCKLSRLCRKKCEIVFLHTAFEGPLTGSVRLLKKGKHTVRNSTTYCH